MEIKLELDERQLDRIFGDFQRKQLPFALVSTATTLAKGVQEAERELLKATFDKPTPFTLNSIAVRPATKVKPVATVFAKDIAAAYLEPFTDGGSHALGGKKGLLVPKGQPTNQYGNLPAGKLKALLARPDVYVGAVKGRDGTMIRGVWQRQTVAQVGRALRAGRRQGPAPVGGQAKTGGLKLLIRFEDALPVKSHLDFRGRAAAYVRKNAETEFIKAFARAMASAK